MNNLRKFKRVMLLCFLLLPLHLVAQLDGEVETYGYYLKPSSMYRAGGSPAGTLGFGFSSDRDTPTIECINPGTTTYGGSAKGLVDVARNYSLEEVKQQLDLSADVSVHAGVFSDDIATQFVHNAETDEYSSSFIYRTAIQLKNSIYNPPAAPAPILNRAGQAHANNTDAFRYYCGDKYMSQIYWGGSLYVQVAFNFANSFDKETFDASISGSITDIASMSAHLSTSVSKLNKNGTITVMGLQVGGDPTKLGKILGGGGGKAPIVSCSFDNMRQCQQLLNNVITYATSSTGDNFPTQIKIGSPETPISAAQMGSDNLDYAYLGLKLSAPSKVTQPILNARKTLLDRLNKTVIDKKRATFLAAHSSYAPYVAQVKQQLDYLQSNYAIINDAGQKCFTDLANCVANVDAALKRLHSVDENVLAGPMVGTYSMRFALPGHAHVSGSPAFGMLFDHKVISENNGKPIVFSFDVSNLNQNARTFKITKMSNVVMHRSCENGDGYDGDMFYIAYNSPTIPFTSGIGRLSHGNGFVGIIFAPPQRIISFGTGYAQGYSGLSSVPAPYISATVEVEAYL